MYPKSSQRGGKKQVTHSEDVTLSESLLQSPHTVVQMQRIVGNRAMNQMLQRKVKTKIVKRSYTPRDGVTSLEAVIGASSLVSRGIKAQKGQPSRINTVGALKGRYVGGHMLNQDLGGDGTSDNMIVQSHKSNTNMNLHDNILKRLSATAERLETMGTTTEKKYEYYVEEDITVNPPNPQPGWNFAGEKHVPESLDVTLTPLKRHKTTKNVTSWTGHGETINNPYQVDNVPPYPKKPGISVKRVNMKALKQRKLKRLAGKPVTGLSLLNLTWVPGIGKAKATAIQKFFKKNPMTLLNAIQANPTGKGFTVTDLNRLYFANLQ